MILKYIFVVKIPIYSGFRNLVSWIYINTHFTLDLQFNEQNERFYNIAEENENLAYLFMKHLPNSSTHLVHQSLKL